MIEKPAFRSRGFYLHACWQFAYPFAVRSWERSDYQSMFRLLRLLGLDRVMLWPMIELAPPPLSPPDADWLASFRGIVDDARAAGLECWVTASPNLSTRPEIADLPMAERHFYPYKHVYRLDDPTDRATYLAHLEDLLAVISNADGYVFIDGDPGGYPGAQPADFVRLFHAAREIIDRVGARPGQQKVVPWIWCGWGADWASDGVWGSPLRPLVGPVLDCLRSDPPGEPWEMLPGRSINEHWANRRINFELTEAAGLVDRSILMTYEIVEFEPTPPAVALQFADIRRVLREELRYASQARGVMANAQQPIMALPNLFYYARCAADPDYLERSDADVLADLAEFLGGPADLLVPAWSCLERGLDELPMDLAERLQAATLSGEAASCLPGGGQRYLTILAAFVRARIGVLRATAAPPLSETDAAIRVAEAAAALYQWWQQHRYVFSGEGRQDFTWDYSHPQLLLPLVEWVQAHIVVPDRVLPLAARFVAERAVMEEAEAAELLLPLLRHELRPAKLGTFELGVG